MSLIAQAFDAVLKQYQDTDHLTMEDLFGHMEPAFAAEGYREPVSAQPQRILIVRLDEIGDCVLMIPMLRELRRALGGDTGLTHIAAAARRPIVEWVCHPLDLPVTVLSSVARFAPWQARVIQVRPAHGAPGCEHLVPGFHEVAGCRSLYKPHCIQSIPPAQIAAAANQLLRRR